MKPSLLLLAAFLVGCGGAPPAVPKAPNSLADAPTPAEPAAHAGAEALARQVVAQLHGGKHELLVARFTADLQTAMGAAELAALWDGLQAQVGQMHGIVKSSSQVAGDHTVVDVTVKFDKAHVIVRVAFDKEARVAGLFVRPAPNETPYAPPSYANPASIVAEEVKFGTAEWPLPGTFTRPKSGGACAALVLVHGSGPNDRDESVGAAKPFRDLALGLSTRGVCVLRYDKRTMVHPKKVAQTFGDNLTVREETVDDALAAVAWLKARKDVDQKRIFVLGHSLGGTVMPRIASAGADIAGFIIAAGSTRPLEDLVLEQVTYLSHLEGAISDKERDVIDKLKKQVANVKSLTAAAKPDKSALPLDIPAAYWLDLHAHPPAELASETRPILVLQGGRDYQVTLDDFAIWQKVLAGRDNATFTRYAQLNHLFIAGEGKSVPSEYLQPGHVDAKVIADIATWIENPSARPRSRN